MPGHGRRRRRLVLSFAAAATSYAVGITLGSPARAEPDDSAETPTPCWAEQIAVSASPTQAAAGHRALTLMFSLAGGGDPCTLTGYPWVDSGAGGPSIHARPTPHGYLGGLPTGVDSPPTVILSIATQGQAIVESTPTDSGGGPCPTYTELLVNPPDTNYTFTVPATIDACALQVHPMTAG